MNLTEEEVERFQEITKKRVTLKDRHIAANTEILRGGQRRQSNDQSILAKFGSF